MRVVGGGLHWNYPYPLRSGAAFCENCVKQKNKACNEALTACVCVPGTEAVYICDDKGEYLFSRSSQRP